MIWGIVGVLLLMFAGGVLTSFAEYKLDYNLYDLIREKVFRQPAERARLDGLYRESARLRTRLGL